MASKKGKRPQVHLQIGRARPTDQYITLRASKKTTQVLLKLADGNGVLGLTEEDLVAAIENYCRPKAEGMAEALMLPAFVGAEAIPVKPINILDKANEIIYGDRERAYGNPRFNLDTIAQFWNVYLHRLFHSWGIDGANLKAEDVAQMMILLKTARLIHNPTHVDSLVDQAGYAALQNRIQG